MIFCSLKHLPFFASSMCFIRSSRTLSVNHENTPSSVPLNTATESSLTKNPLAFTLSFTLKFLLLPETVFEAKNNNKQQEIALLVNLLPSSELLQIHCFSAILNRQWPEESLEFGADMILALFYELYPTTLEHYHLHRLDPPQSSKDQVSPEPNMDSNNGQ